MEKEEGEDGWLIRPDKFSKEGQDTQKDKPEEDKHWRIENGGLGCQP